MAETYTRMWDAFLGGEWAGGEEISESDPQYLQQTRDFYSNIMGPAFNLTGFGEGESGVGGWYAAFNPERMQQAEETFRSEIGDPYVSGQDPFAWEKISRYDLEGGVTGRVQQLLESELYKKGKLLGGATGAEYGLETSRELEDYTTGMKGEEEALTYGALTSGASLASGTSGVSLRSGEATEVAEDVLIEAYKKAKTLGSDYRAGLGDVQTSLEEDLNTALTTYLNTIDAEKSRWFGDVMRNVQTFEDLEMDRGEDDIRETLDLSEEMPGFYAEWGCGYGMISDGQGGCMEDPDITTGGQEFRTTDICGIGEIYNETTGLCEIRQDLDLTEDSYGYFCKEADLDDCGVCWGDGGCGGSGGSGHGDCAEDEEWNSVTGQCEWTGTSGAQWGSSHCARPENSCPSGECCCDNGMCSSNCCGGDEYDPFWNPNMNDIMGTCPNGEEKLPDGSCPGTPRGGF